jgi:glycyl-tRNA synthetase
MDKLKLDFNIQYEEKDAIGKRYRRQDAIGTPFCITVDHQTLEDNTVTIRHRDTMAQERVPADHLIK